MARRRKKSLLSKILGGVAKGLLSEPAKTRKNAKRRAQSARRKRNGIF